MNSPLLHVEAGAYWIMVDALAVHEILQPGQSDFSSDASQMAWRDEVLTVMDIRRLLGGGGANPALDAPTVLVYSAMPEQKLALIFDGVMGIRSPMASEKDLAALPQSSLLPEELYQIFDGVMSDLKGTARQIYHMRRPFDLISFHRSMSPRL